MSLCRIESSFDDMFARNAKEMLWENRLTIGLVASNSGRLDLSFKRDAALSLKGLLRNGFYKAYFSIQWLLRLTSVRDACYIKLKNIRATYVIQASTIVVRRLHHRNHTIMKNAIMCVPSLTI